jgi:NodT family efflux transporter outer membrane factor (OMF) lipoprotein
MSLVGALCGCTVGPNYSPPTPDVPSAWRGAAAPQAPLSAVSQRDIEEADWWKSFGDPELTSLINRALAANMAAQEAVLRIEEARAQRRVVAAAAWPSLDANASYSETRISEKTATTSLLSALGGSGAAQGGAPGGVSSALPGLQNPFSQYQYGLTGSWEIDLFGRVRRQVEAADANTAAAIEDRRAVQVSLMAEVAAAYIDLRSAQEQHAVSEQAAATAKRLLQVATDARRAEIGDDIDVANARAALETTQAVLPPLEVEITADESQLALLLAEKPGALDSELERAKAIPPLPPAVPIGLPSALARRRPDIREAEAHLHAAVAQQGVAVADLYPRVSLTAALGLEAATPAGLGVWAARYFSAGPGLDVPLFDAGARQATVHIADVRAKEAAVAYAQTVLAALHEVEDAVMAYQKDQIRRGSLDAAVTQDRTALSLMRVRYQVGSVGLANVLHAEQELETAEASLASSTAATAQDLVTLYKSLGGGWENAPSGPSPAVASQE